MSRFNRLLGWAGLAATLCAAPLAADADVFEYAIKPRGEIRIDVASLPGTATMSLDGVVAFDLEARWLRAGWLQLQAPGGQPWWVVDNRRGPAEVFVGPAARLRRFGAMTVHRRGLMFSGTLAFAPRADRKLSFRFDRTTRQAEIRLDGHPVIALTSRPGGGYAHLLTQRKAPARLVASSGGLSIGGPRAAPAPKRPDLLLTRSHNALYLQVPPRNPHIPRPRSAPAGRHWASLDR